MRYSWRWFGQNDLVSLDDVRQAGAHEIVCALYDVPIGDIWQYEAIKSLKAMIEQDNHHKTPLYWRIVESIPLHDDIKRGADGWQKYADNFIESCINLAKNDIYTIAYNFMPLIDWTRTDLAYRLPTGATTLRFDYIDFVAFDLYILERSNADKDYSLDIIDQAKMRYDSFDNDKIKKLEKNIIAGLPGGMSGSHDLQTFRALLTRYHDIDHALLQQNLLAFLRYVTPICEEYGVVLAIHPDDPPFSLFGLPRVVSSRDDLDFIVTNHPSPSNKLTFCTGSLGAGVHNDVLAMTKEFAPHIAFAHLRSTIRDQDMPYSFQESDHLAGDCDMVGIIKHLLREEKNRKADDTLSSEIPFRPDHGYQMLDDVHKQTNPGYSAIGRLKGLAEIHGVISAFSQQ